MIVDYKNQAKEETLTDNMLNLQLKLYEAIAPQILDSQGNKIITNPSKVLGVAKLIAKKPKHKYRAQGSANESMEEYRLRAGTQAQFIFVNANPELAAEFLREHKRINKELNTLEPIADNFPRNRKACVGIYGKCDYYDICNKQAAEGTQGFALIGEDTKHISACLKQMTTAKEAVENAEDFW